MSRVEIEAEAGTAYQALKAFGFSAAKAAEVLLDSQRGDAYAASFVKLALESRA